MYNSGDCVHDTDLKTVLASINPFRTGPVAILQTGQDFEVTALPTGSWEDAGENADLRAIAREYFGNAVVWAG